jgi:hypothetical protein
VSNETNNNTVTTANAFREWAVVELMGHRKLAGWVTEEERFGSKFLRLDIPGATADEKHFDLWEQYQSGVFQEEGVVIANPFASTQFYGAAAIYCVTPVKREIAIAFAQRNQPVPVTRFELPQLQAAVPVRSYGDDSWDSDDDD